MPCIKSIRSRGETAMESILLRDLYFTATTDGDDMILHFPNEVNSETVYHAERHWPNDNSFISSSSSPTKFPHEGTYVADNDDTDMPDFSRVTHTDTPTQHPLFLEPPRDQNFLHPFFYLDTPHKSENSRPSAGPTEYSEAAVARFLFRRSAVVKGTDAPFGPPPEPTTSALTESSSNTITEPAPGICTLRRANAHRVPNKPKPKPKPTVNTPNRIASLRRFALPPFEFEGRISAPIVCTDVEATGIFCSSLCASPVDMHPPPTSPGPAVSLPHPRSQSPELHLTKSPKHRAFRGSRAFVSRRSWAAVEQMEQIDEDGEDSDVDAPFEAKLRKSAKRRGE